ncbi:MAG: hypothetical protein DRQ88_10805 [Epsilonproteobacteria bacterium]|nr:MAG: hypothetical protein DRQ88_10805 [Campylobacterota bacterium]RLA65774.1 MAG: hypothetical protein DRQ89_00020 [Campylobacterota bacterium]
MRFLLLFLITFNLYAVDFAEVQEKIFDVKCVICHSGPFAPLGLDLFNSKTLQKNTHTEDVWDFMGQLHLWF